MQCSLASQTLLSESYIPVYLSIIPHTIARGVVRSFASEIAPSGCMPLHEPLRSRRTRVLSKLEVVRSDAPVNSWSVVLRMGQRMFFKTKIVEGPINYKNRLRIR